jgi:hypothetical protein
MVKFRISLDRLRAAEGMPFHILFMNIRQVELPSTIETDSVRPLLDGEDATQVTVMASKRKSENPTQRVHRSCSRLRSKLPLASSHASKARTLARARAMEQSAAP